MRQSDWERDIELRQRNIVFPDATLNAGRFYQNILQTNIRLTPMQRAGVAVLAISFHVSSAAMLAASIQMGRDRSLVMPSLVIALIGLICLILGWLLLKRAVYRFPGVKHREKNKNS